MFEDYIQDSFTFFTLGENVVATDERGAKMFYRASVFCAASSLEAFVNFIGDTLEKGNGLNPIEKAFLNDCTLEISPSKGSVEGKVKYFSLDSKVKFIIKRFNVPIDPLVASQWRHFKEFKKLRDSLVHPRNTSDELKIEDYRNQIKNGLNANIDIMDAISRTLFGKPLRKGLTDLKL